MIAALKSITQKSNASGRVVDGKLILSFPHAKTPVVWQMDLAQAKASALEVLQSDKETGFNLTLKNPKGEKVEIASFETREEAIEGLMAASNALENGQGNIQVAANTDQKIAVSHGHKKSSLGKWITGIIAIIALAILVNVYGSIAPRSPGSLQPTSANVQPTQSSNAQATGVPVSADDFLNGL